MPEKSSWHAAWGVLLTLWSLGAAAEGGIPPDDREFFEAKIRPLLVEKCYRCHSTRAKRVKAGLFLDSRAGWMRGGDTGDPAVVPGRPEESLLWIAVSYEDPDLQMPPKGKLEPSDLAAIREWIARGAPDPRTGTAGAETRETHEVAGLDIAKRRDAHWAWQPVQAVRPPPVEDSGWPEDALDRFILARLEAAGLAPARPAPKTVWLRRVTFALTGLPPAREDIEAFLRDTSPRAFADVVDRLLESPRFGERWAQHWLDLVRYAETKGHEGDYPIPYAYRYRDYVIRALNADVPYDRFVTEHVAGDLIDPPRVDAVDRTNQSIQGTGFWHLGEATHSPVDIRGEEADRVANQIDVFSKTFLGLTVGCARCHDHKFDAISTEDYYALAGYLQSSSYHEVDVADPAAQKRADAALRSLRDEYVPRITRAYAAAVRERSCRIDQYLLAARDAWRKKAEGAHLIADVTAGLARERGLSGDVLNAWMDLLEGAREDPADPFYAFAVLAASGEDDPASVTRLKSGILETWREREKESARRLREQKVIVTAEQGERNYVKTERRAEEDDELVDYRRPGPDDWITVGHRFGPGPATPGDVVLGRSADRPIERIVERAAATTDLSSDRFSGMLRTRTFEVTSDTLWYRFRGKADVFLAVDSHRTVYGPLHGVVKQKLDGDGGYEWKAHHVRDYIGHRVHVEFTPSGEFSLSEIRFCGSKPLEEFRANTWLVRLLESPATSLPAIARLYEEMVVGCARDLAGGAEDPCERSDTAAITNWLLRHDRLLDSGGEASARLSEVFEEYAAKKVAIEKGIPEPIRALALIDGSGENEYVHIRGNHKTLAKEPVGRRFLSALVGTHPRAPEHGSGRLELARQMTAPGNPLLARVLVNRLWYHLFGSGIVQTVDDFGVMGERPTHPLLLDYLAGEFVRGGWSIKGLLRRMVLSSTYRMSSHPDDRAAEIDPANRLFHRMPIRRLDGEAIRDSILAISGRLDPAMYGPSVRIHITPFMRGNRSPKESGPIDGDGRRSIYVEVRRNHLSHFLTTFDKPPPFTTIGKRGVSNSPAQPLILLNDPLVHQEARRWAERLLSHADWTARERVREACFAAFGRAPEDREVCAALEFLGEGESGEDRTQAWADLCHTLINVKEFIFIN